MRSRIEGSISGHMKKIHRRGALKMLGLFAFGTAACGRTETGGDDDIGENEDGTDGWGGSGGRTPSVDEGSTGVGTDDGVDDGSGDGTDTGPERFKCAVWGSASVPGVSDSVWGSANVDGIQTLWCSAS